MDSINVWTWMVVGWFNSYSEELLSSYDKEAKKRQIKNLLGKLTFEDNSRQDLYDTLEEKIKIDT